MILSYVVYIGSLLLCWLFSYLAQRRNSRLYVWLIIFTLTLVAGFRDFSVGMDTQNYVVKFDLIANGAFGLAFGLEESFKYIVHGLLSIFPNMTFLLTLFAFVTSWCIITRFWELREVSSFVCMVLCYYMAFYFMSFNAIRQFVAVGIVFYCTRYLTQNKIPRYIIGVLLAMQFHQSALIGFVLLAVNCLRWKELPQNQKVLYLMIVLVSPVVLVTAVRLFARYARYFANISLDIGFMVPLKLLFLTATLVFVFGMHHRLSYFRGGETWGRTERFNVLMSSIGYFAALLMATLGYLFPYVERISCYFYLFEGVYYGVLLKGKQAVNRIVFGYFICFVVGYGFVYSILHNSQGTMPYAFIW